MNLLKKKVAVLVCSLMIFFMTPFAQGFGPVNEAYEGPVWFQITEVFVSTVESLYFRVSAGDGGYWHCTGGPSYPGWSFVEYSDPTAKIKISALMSAYLTGKTVRVWTQGVNIDWDGDGNTEHYCQIMQVQVEQRILAKKKLVLGTKTFL